MDTLCMLWPQRWMRRCSLQAVSIGCDSNGRRRFAISIHWQPISDALLCAANQEVTLRFTLIVAKTFALQWLRRSAPSSATHFKSSSKLMECFPERIIFYTKKILSIIFSPKNSGAKLSNFFLGSPLQ